MKRWWIVLPLVLLIAIAVWHPPAAAPIAVATQAPLPVPHRPHRRSAAETVSGGIVVYVAGAVVHPGLYTLAPSARIDAAVRAAGGFLPQADRAGVNLAAHPNDGDEIDVPTAGASGIAVRAKRTRGTRSTRTKKTSAVVAVNTAGAAQLASIPGIGPTIAARIVAVRERDGAYTSFDQLLDVAGMTPARLDRAEPYLRL